ncbi:UNVERIFIED_CONTAM: hypothetical protein RMT77_012100 [Armadillidium vulgare]
MNTYDNENTASPNITSQNEDEDPSIQSVKTWDMNYLEAAIYLEEGENNDKFDSHPRNHNALPAYLLTHNHWFYTLDLAASLILLLLALMENPAISMFEHVPIGVHGSIELLGLALLGISIAMQMRWLGWRTFIKHKRSMVKSVTWIMMVLEALAVLARNTTHFRVTRSLRPIFLVDNRYLGGVRRLLRQILQSLPPILEVLALLLFTLLIFAVFGFYLFSSNEKDPYFETFYHACISLYVLLTTANYPDVMMPAYANNKWSALFFIAYLSITLYFITNLMLAIVFVEFSNIEKEKFRKLLLHKREACQHAFQLLITNSHPNRVTYKNFQGLMHHYKPKASRKYVYLLFKVLNRSKSGFLNLKEFYGFYDALEFRWYHAKEKNPWFAEIWEPFNTICHLNLKFVKSRGFRILVYVVIVISALILLVRTVLMSLNSETPQTLHITWDQLACIIFYIVEIFLKLFAYGLEDYFASGWNVFDFLVTAASVGGILAQNFGTAFFYVVILRPLRLLRLLRVRQRYRDIFQTFAILLPRIGSTVIVIFIIYYFFAIVGMECFSMYDMKNCCKNTTVEQFYKADNTTIYNNYYYLNNFDTLLISGVTLFELTVVNNWFIIMEGYASVSGEWSRLYFMIFYLVMMVVLAIVVAFVIEAFTFRMKYNEAFQHDSKESENIKTNIRITREELDYMYSGEKSLRMLQDYTSELNGIEDTYFVGIRKRTKFVLQRRMYSELISSWLREHSQTSASCSYQQLTEEDSSSTLDLRSTDSPSPLHQSPFDTFSNMMQTTPLPGTEASNFDREIPFFPSSILVPQQVASSDVNNLTNQN